MLENLKISKIQKCVSCLHSLNIFVSISHKSKVKVSVRISFPLPSIIPQYFQVFKSVDCSLNCPLLRNLPEAIYSKKFVSQVFSFVLNILEIFNGMLRTFLCFFKTKQVESLQMVYYTCIYITYTYVIFYMHTHSLHEESISLYICFYTLIWLLFLVCGLILKSELSSNINCSEIFLVFLT